MVNSRFVNHNNSNDNHNQNNDNCTVGRFQLYAIIYPFSPSDCSLFLSLQLLICLLFSNDIFLRVAFYVFKKVSDIFFAAPIPLTQDQKKMLLNKEDFATILFEGYHQHFDKGKRTKEKFVDTIEVYL